MAKVKLKQLDQEGAANGQVCTFNTGTGLWEPATPVITPLASTAPPNVTKTAAETGVGTTAARAEHKHDVTTATAVELTDSTNAEGAATSLARSNHTHAHGNRGGGSLHALAVAGAPGTPGFMSGIDKAKLDGINTTRSKFYAIAGNASTSVGSYNTVSVGSNADVEITFEFPADFGALTKLDIVGIPAGTFTNKDIDLTSQYAAPGELYNAHGAADTTGIYSGVADTIFNIPIGSLYASASALDFAGIMLKHNAIGTNVRYLGVRMEYTAA